MTLEEITRLVEELNVMKEVYPEHSKYIESLKNQYREQLRAIAIDYELKINCFYALISQERRDC